MSGAAISGFVDGLFRGIGVRHGWEDRKREIGRQKRSDEIRDSAEARAAQEHTRRMKAMDNGLSDWERGRADSDFYRTAYEDAATATDASFGAMPQGQTPGAKPNEAPEQPDLTSPAHGVAMELGIDPRLVRQNRSADIMTRLSPADKLQAQADAQPVAAKRAGSSPTIDRRAQFEPRPDMAPAPAPAPQQGIDRRAQFEPMEGMAPAHPTQTNIDTRAQQIADGLGITVEEYLARAPNGSRYSADRRPVAQGMPTASPGGIRYLPDGTAVMPAPRGAIADELGAARGGPVGPNFVPNDRLYTAPQGEAAAATIQPDPRRTVQPVDSRSRGQRISDAIGPVRRFAAESADKTLGAFAGVGSEAYGTLQQGAGYVAGAVGAPETADMLLDAGTKNRTQARDQATKGFFAANGSERPEPSASPSAQGQTATPQAAPEQAAAPQAYGAGTPGAVPPAHIPMKAAATPQEKQDAAAAVEVLDKTATPAAKDATVAATQAMGVKPQQKTVTDAQYKRGGQAWMERYIEVGAPKVLEALISRGEFAKAEAFQSFMQTSSTKAAMKDLGVASAAFLLGDADKGASQLMKVFNNLGYFPDGTQVVDDETDFTRDKDGNINGLKMTFRDADSGNTWEMVETGDVASLMTKLVPMVMPENAFEFYWKQQESATAAVKGAATAADAAAKSDQARIDKLAADIFKQSAEIGAARVGPDGKPLPPMTIDEAYAEATRVINGGRAPQGQAAVPPAAYRPN